MRIFFVFIIFIWNEYECQFSCCLLLLLFVVDFFPFKNLCFLVINYVSADAVAAAAQSSLLRSTDCAWAHTLIQDHLSSIFGLHASIAEPPERRVAKFLCDFGNFLGTQHSISERRGKTRNVFLAKLNDIITAFLLCRALNANIFVAGLVSSWAGWGNFLSGLDLGFHLEKFENLYKLHKW